MKRKRGKYRKHKGEKGEVGSVREKWDDEGVRGRGKGRSGQQEETSDKV